MFKLLHTGDIHLGRQFPALKVKANEYRSQLINTFEKIADLAAVEKVSLVLITGDLFDTNRVFGLPVNKTLSIFKKLELSNIRVCLIPGSHDDYSADSIYRCLSFPSNVTLLTPKHSQQTFSDLNLTICGMVPGTWPWEMSPFQGLPSIGESRFHVGMAHCLVDSPEQKPENQVVLETSEIANSGLDYLALGHQHFFQDCSQGNTPACYCGSPEPLDMDLRGTGQVVVVTLTEDNKAQFQAISIGTKKSDSVTIDVTNLDSIQSVIPMIQTRADPNLILKVFLVGTSHIDNFLNFQEIEELLGDYFFNIRIIDNSHPDLEAINLQNYPDKTMTGRYLRILQDKIAAATTAEDKSLYEATLKLGFALLQGNIKVRE
jgi:DNA repair protein SbcD/Mre11